MPQTDGFLCPTGKSRYRPSVASISRRHVVARVDDLHDQIQNSDNSPVENTLWSYVFNLQRARKSRDIKPARSLAHYLQTNQISNNATKSIVEVLERALTQALRLCGEMGDYKSIWHLVDGAVQFSQGNPVLKPRIFGEALDALSQTRANISKIKQVWNLATTGNTPFLSTALTAFELNVMLKTLASRGKVGACIDLYRHHADPDVAQQNSAPHIRPDAYTASILFSILTDSIHEGQELEAPRKFSTAIASEASELESSLRMLSKSQCWQWNEAVELLSTLRQDTQWNNYAYSSLIKLQDKSQELIRGHENGARIVMVIFDSLMSQGIHPDVVTCTLAIKSMGDPKSDPTSWKLAVHFLQQLQSDPRLPNPNEYSYSAAIVACARCHEYTMALELLKEMRNGLSKETSFVPPKPNTWVYNAALSAMASSEEKSHRGRENFMENNRQELALRLLDQMKYDNEHLGFDTKPDTVTYNTIISIRRSKLSDAVDPKVTPLIDQMKQEGVPRDVITYRNAITSCNDASSIIHLLRTATEDIDGQLSKGGKVHGVGTKGSHDMTYVYNTALSAAPLQNNLKMFKEALHLMQTYMVPANSETLIHVITSLGQSGKPAKLLELLAELQKSGVEDNDKPGHLSEIIGISLTTLIDVRLDSTHYVAAIKSFLVRNKLDDARAILALMRDHGLPPTSECLESFAFAYAQAAIRAIPKKNTLNQPSTSVAASRAQSAYTVAMTLKDLSPAVLSKVAQACAKTAQWQNVQSILRHVHSNMLSKDAPLRRSEVDLVRGMHSTLIRECARQENVTAALSYANDIQNFAVLVRTKSGDDSQQEKTIGKNISESIMASLRELQASSPSSFVGMRSEDWVSLIKSASSAGHWKVCVNTLQFLRTHVQRTNPNKRKDVAVAVLDSQYEQLTPALIATCICLEKRSQYAWGERVLDEWMAWSGRKPRPEAVLATIRSLANNEQGEEVKSLLSRCIEGDTIPAPRHKNVGYEEMLYIGTITTLHNNGIYDDADEVFISAITQNHLPFIFGKREDDDVFVLDLHGLNVAMAHSAVRVALRRVVSERGKSVPPKTHDMMIITGRGWNSALRLRPVLRPEIQRMLLEEFYPPLNTVSVPGNTGALMVYDNDISAWQTHQQEQKGARMLTLAALLKNASTDRIKSIASRLGASDKN